MLHILPSSTMPASAPAHGDLTTRAMLCSLHVKQWAARRLDKPASAEVNAAKGAAANVARVNKSLIGRTALAEIGRVANQAREEHYKRTLPWSDAGPRILPAAAFLPFQAAMRELESAFDAAVAAFLASYPDFVEAAKRDMGELFNPGDYPDPRHLKTLFSLSHRFSNLPSAGDFRVTMSAEHAEAVRAAIAADVQDSLAGAVRDTFQRVADSVGRMAERLAAYKPASDAGRAEGVFRDSLVSNVAELAELLPALNVTGDPVLAGIAARLPALCERNADELRQDDNARARVAAEAAAIVAQVSDYLA